MTSGHGVVQPVKVKPLVCVLCDRGFKLLRSLEQHVAAVHPDGLESSRPFADNQRGSSYQLVQEVGNDRSVHLLNGPLPLRSLLQLAHSAAHRHPAAMDRWLSRQGYAWHGRLRACADYHSKCDACWRVNVPHSRMQHFVLPLHPQAYSADILYFDRTPVLQLTHNIS
jgi:hypothetical protein